MGIWGTAEQSDGLFDDIYIYKPHNPDPHAAVGFERFEFGLSMFLFFKVDGKPAPHSPGGGKVSLYLTIRKSNTQDGNIWRIGEATGKKVITRVARFALDVRN